MRLNKSHFTNRFSSYFILFFSCLIFTSCNVINSHKGRAKFKAHLLNEINLRYNNSFKIENIWVYDEFGKIKGYKAIIVDKKDPNLSFEYVVENIKNLSFDSLAFHQSFLNAKTFVDESYLFKQQVAEYFNDATVSTKTLENNFNEERRISNIYSNQSLTHEKIAINKADSLFSILSKKYGEPKIIYNIYFASEHRKSPIELGNNGILKYELFHDMYLYHYRVDFIKTDSGYIKTNPSLTLNLTGPDAIVMQKKIRSFLGKDINPETERDKSYLVVEKDVSRNIDWARFIYLDSNETETYGFINVHNKDIVSDTINYN